MQIKQFQSLNKFLSILSKVIAVIALVILVFGSFNLLFSQRFPAFSFDKSNAFSIVFANSAIKDTEYAWATSIMIPIVLAFLGYIFFKASYLFDYLAEGITPFSHQFSHSVKIMGFILITYDLVTSLLYSLFVTFATNGGVFFYFSLSSFFMIGLILYLASGILNYGINLQELAEEKIRIENEKIRT